MSELEIPERAKRIAEHVFAPDPQLYTSFEEGLAEAAPIIVAEYLRKLAGYDQFNSARISGRWLCMKANELDPPEAMP